MHHGIMKTDDTLCLRDLSDDDQIGVRLNQDQTKYSFVCCNNDPIVTYPPTTNP